ncbi:MAG: rhodanese-like domain-containing protein [Verrucomicrobiota bacterium]|nr:rhodanese-like domain-containing protein [Verrucomicrobiota bacterium]
MKTFSSLLLAPLLLILPVTAGNDEKKSPTIVHVDARQAGELLSDPDKKNSPIIIDIRTSDEFREGHLKGARQIDFLEEGFAEKVRKLDRSRSYLIHCRSGGRSSRSLALWKKMKFKKVYHLDGGILAWEKAGLPVVK